MEERIFRIGHEEFMITNPKIAIGISIQNTVSKDFLIPFEESRDEWKIKRYLTKVVWDDRVPLDFSRNNIVRNAIHNNVDYILFLDSDIVLPPGALGKLLSWDKDIVTGIYYWKAPPYYPIIMKKNKTGNAYTPIFNFKDYSGLIEIDATGFGCCLVKVDVFRNIPDPWFTNTPEPNKVEGDLNFCKLAQKHGYNIYADNSIICGHYGILLTDDIRTNSRNYVGGYLKDGEQPVELIKYLVDKYKPKSVLDVGCGPLGSVKIFDNLNIPTWGIDGDFSLLKRKDLKDYLDLLTIHDIEQKVYKSIRTYDMVFSYEVAEHISNVDNYVETITENCKDILIMTHALPGQGGYNHVNEQDDDYWINKITTKGFVYLEDETKNARLVNDFYFKKSGLIFKRAT